MPSAWPPWVLDIAEGRADAQFADLYETEHIIQMARRHYKQVLQLFAAVAQGFDPSLQALVRLGRDGKVRGIPARYPTPR